MDRHLADTAPVGGARESRDALFCGTLLEDVVRGAAIGLPDEAGARSGLSSTANAGREAQSRPPPVPSSKAWRRR
jgi:hypothetical protein